jgi:tRNA (cmo5U34)-methyltransferase
MRRAAAVALLIASPIVVRVHQWHSHDTAADWDARGGEQLPTRLEQQDVFLALVAASEVGDGAVLDLGIGSGLVAEAVLDALPDAQLVGVDFSAAMLDLARVRLERFGSRVSLLQHDLSALDSIVLPDLRYRVAFSIQTMHHLSDSDKAAAFAWAAEVVDPGGLVVIVDRVKVDELLFHDWAVVWGRLGSKTPETYAEHVDELARAGDRPALLQDQLAWLESAGLHACCLHLYGNRAVIVGRKPG